MVLTKGPINVSGPKNVIKNIWKSQQRSSCSCAHTHAHTHTKSKPLHPPQPLYHAKMGVLPTPCYSVTIVHTPLNLLAWRHLWMVPYLVSYNGEVINPDSGDVNRNFTDRLSRIRMNKNREKARAFSNFVQIRDFLSDGSYRLKQTVCKQKTDSILKLDFCEPMANTYLAF